MGRTPPGSAAPSCDVPAAGPRGNRPGQRPGPAYLVEKCWCLGEIREGSRRAVYFFTQLESASTQRRNDASNSAETISNRPLSETPSHRRRTIAGDQNEGGDQPYSMAVARPSTSCP